MSNILGLITINGKEVLEIDGDPTSGGGVIAPIGSMALWNDSGVGRSYIKKGSLATDWEEVSTSASNGTVQSGTAGRISVYPNNGNNIDDVYVQNGQNITISHATHPTRTTDINYTIPNPGDSISSASFVLTEGNQTINGNKTFNNNVTVGGDLTVNGTLTYINSTQTQITDKLITLNKGGPANSGDNSGIEIEENNTITGYFMTLATRDGWILKSPAIANTASFSFTSLTANRTYTLPNNGGTLTLGTGGASRVAFWTNANTVSSNSNFSWDNTNIRLGIGTSSASHSIHTTGAIRSEVLSTGVVKSNSSGVLSSGLVSLTTEVSGILPIANGGTNSGAALNDNRIMVSSGGAIVESGVLNDGQLLIGSTGGAPVVANITQGTNQGVTITNGPGSIQLQTVQDIRVTASPTFNNISLTSKTAGSVLFSGAGGSILENNNNLFYDNFNNRLGVGTNAPARRLDVSGTSLFRGALRIEDPSASNANYEIFQAETTTTDATPTNLVSIPTITNSAMFLKAKIIGRRTGGTGGAPGDCAVYERSARIKNVSGTVTIHNLQADYTSEDQAAWNATFIISGTNVVIRVTGAANNDITWVATYEVMNLS